MPNRERYYVREHSGCSGSTRRAKWETEYMVIDRDYCHRVIQSFPVRSGLTFRGHSTVQATAKRAASAAELCAALNREES